MTGIDHSVRQLREQFRIWRRRLLAGAIVFILGIMALSQFVVAARLVLERAMGPIGSRLFVGFLLLAVIGVIALTTWKFHPSRGRTPEQADKVGSIVEAISLGYVLAQDLKAAAGFGRDRAKKDKPDETAKAAEPPPEP